MISAPTREDVGQWRKEDVCGNQTKTFVQAEKKKRTSGDVRFGAFEGY